jgi:hypothetical protein
LGPKIGRVLWKMFWKRSGNGFDHEEWLSAILLGRYYDCTPVPILRVLIRELNLKWQPEKFNKFRLHHNHADLYDLLGESMYHKPHLWLEASATMNCIDYVAKWYNVTTSDIFECEEYIKTRVKDSEPWQKFELQHWLLDVILQTDVGDYSQIRTDESM